MRTVYSPAQMDAELAGLVAKLAKPPFLLVWGQRTAKRARETARGKGGRHFWRDLARSVQVESASESSVSVYTAHVAAAQKQFGGTIRPVNAKALTIPVSDEARGKRASEFESGGRELFVLDLGKDTDTIGLLGYADTDGDFHALFVLRRKVTQAPEPWWPDEETVARFGLEEARRFVAKELQA